MQIVDINTAARVWMVLPGKKAAAFRSNLADLFIRVLGGDETLAMEIKQIGEFEDSLPDTHPLRAVRMPAPVEAPPPNYNGDVTAIVSTITNHIDQGMSDRFQVFHQHMEDRRSDDRDAVKKAMDELNESLSRTMKANAERVEMFFVDQQNPGVDLTCRYTHLVKCIESVNVSGASDFNFRSEFNGFCITLANVFFHTLQKKTPVDTAEFIKAFLNVDVNFARSYRRWSSLCARTLIQACTVLRVRQWICKDRGLRYPDPEVTSEIKHSTYLSVRCYLSFLSHVDRVWEERGYDGCVVLGNMISALMEKFGADLIVYDNDEPIEYGYGARAPMPTQPQVEQTVSIHPASKQNASERERNAVVQFLKHFKTVTAGSGMVSCNQLMVEYNSYALNNNLATIGSKLRFTKFVTGLCPDFTTLPKLSSSVRGWCWK